MNRSTKNKLAEAGTKVGATLFGKLMDHFARKRPNGLVAKFRKQFGRITPDQIEDAVEQTRCEVDKNKN